MDEVEKFFFANFQILGPLGCQGWVVIPQNVKKSKNHCTITGQLHVLQREYMYWIVHQLVHSDVLDAE